MAVEIPTRLFNSALMVAPQSVNEILSVKATGSKPPPPDSEKNYVKDTQAYADSGMVVLNSDNNGYAIVDGVAVLEVTGGLTYRAYNWWTTSYLDIRDTFRAALSDERVQSILLLIDSPGGEVAGLFDLVDEIYNARETKPIIAVAAESAYSAAYAIASAASEIYLSDTDSVGSVGVIAIHIDQTGFDNQIGVKYTTIFAGDHKNDFSPHEPLKPKCKEILQAHVDKLYDKFTAVVARNRNMSQEAVVATQAGFFMGKEAVNIGFADGISSIDNIIKNMVSKKGDIGMNLNDVKEVVTQAIADNTVEVKKILTEQGLLLSHIESLLPQGTFAAGTTVGVLAADSQKQAAEISLEKILAAQKAEQVTAITDIVDLCESMGMPALAGSMIRDGLSLNEAKQVILDAKAKVSEQVTIVSTVGALAITDANPLMEDAKKRAESILKNK
jgi:signal peptide peptidase SppA